MNRNEVVEDLSVGYVVTWISNGGLCKSISFSNRHSAARHMRNMEQDGYRAVMKVVQIA